MAARRSTGQSRGRGRKASAPGRGAPPRRTKPAPRGSSRPAIRRLVERLRELIREAAPEAVETVKWGMPVFTQQGLVCYIKASAEDVTLGFFGEDRRPRAAGAKAGSGTETAMQHVKIRTEDDIKPRVVAGWIRRAVARNLRSR